MTNGDEWGRMKKRNNIPTHESSLTPSVGAGYDGGVALGEELAGEALLELGAGVPLAVLVARVADDLAGEREELVAPRQQRRHHEAQLRRSLVHAHLRRTGMIRAFIWSLRSVTVARRIKRVMYPAFR